MRHPYKSLSIKAKITTAVLFLFIASCWILTFSIEQTLKNRMVSLLQAQQYATISYIASDIDSKIQQRIELINKNAQLLSENTALLDSPSQTRDFLKGRIGLQALFEAGLVVIDKRGRGIADYPSFADREHASFVELEYFQEAMATGKTSIGKARVGRFSKKPGVAIAAPIRDVSGNIAGVIVGFATLADNTLFGQVEQGKAGETGWILIVSPRDQMVVTSSDAKKVFQPLPAPGANKMLDRILQGYGGSGLALSHDGIESLVSAKNIPWAGWVAIMALPTGEAFAPIREMTRQAYSLALVLTLLAACTIWALIRHALKPLERATLHIREATSARKEMKTLILDGGQEIQDLIQSFNTLVAQRAETENELRAAQQFVQTALDGLTAHICVLDREGKVLAVNRAWREFAATNQGHTMWVCEGANYLAACKRLADEHADEAHLLASGLQDVLSGNNDFFEIEYPCHSPTEKRWFLARISRLHNEGSARVVVAHENITARKLAEDTVARSEKNLREAQHVAQLGSWELDLVTNELSWSEEIFNIFQIDPKKFAASYEAFLETIHPDDREQVNQAFAASVRNRTPYDIQHRLLLADGTIKFVHERGETSYGVDGKPLRSTGTVQDITLSALNELALKESEERFRTIADYTYNWESWQGPGGEFLYISPSCLRITGYTQGEFISRPNLVHEIILPEDRHLMEAHIDDIRKEDIDAPLDYRIRRKDGEIRWIAHGCRAVYARDGRFLGRRTSNRDITDRKKIEEQVQQLAYFDTLTGLPNRRMLQDRLNRALLQARRHERALAVMFLDLDNFKKINDTLGHDAGDKLLMEVAKRLEGCIRKGDTVARQGGDEFIIVLAEISEPADATPVAEKIIAALAEPVLIDKQSLCVTTSIGIAVYSSDCNGDGIDDTQELLKKADLAMYAVKAEGRNGYRFFAG